jgi:hypothetical protein
VLGKIFFILKHIEYRRSVGKKIQKPENVAVLDGLIFRRLGKIVCMSIRPSFCMEPHGSQ